ncbi:Pao retrotransposon peptidase [Oesophagostomum dentatum]|uniref:Pao retrotransposon peptidase n=1 Tax=Oesophagostomum dentatum TaxID=61180 RepID=A0A0B1TD61_OESDE|nr:Pao retrotransposon peptidase [Oesophagostomum dentatum]
MQLPIQGISSLNIKTFGKDHAKEQNHRLVTVCLVDVQGQEHKFQMYDSPFITSHSKAPTLSQEDIRFIKSNKINLCRPPDNDEQLQILLGCDYLWDLLEGKQCKLPSGLHLISTKFGHMISGQKTPKEQALKSEEVLKMEPERKNNEADVWDKYWTIESTGINEYTGTEKSEKQLVDEKIINKFKETIVKRPDGYYVRLPWKDDKTPLPDNKNMALARLRSLFRQYRNGKEDLLEIDDIFKTQLEQGIIEPVRETTIPPTNEKVHYLPYQVVVTPEKKTTLKRIVFDASAHPVGKPSLNDLLYQGPLILPNIVGILMRFRTGKVATIADIEKACLQVRLNAQDRNVTRFLWVKDVNKPLDDLNIQIYRFTRVTFGLNASPFLLAATFDYHLDNTVKNEKVANQIKANMYVDNLLLTSETTQEAFEQYKIAKTIFSGLNMNMREFISNDLTLMNLIPNEDKAQTSTPKVLGIQWKITEDNLVIKCTPELAEPITKRTVLQTNATIYDPLGLLLPLLVRSKSFFQSLWKKSYSWDETLSDEDREQCRKLSNSIGGFQKEIPRRIAEKHADYHLITFSDASLTAMTAFTYLKSESEQRLLMAKSKLPSIKGTHTVPKLEMNALTIAARLSPSAYE